MIRKLINQNQLSVFLVAAFGWAWGMNALYLTFGLYDGLPALVNTFPRQWGLPIGAFVVVLASDVSLRAWVKKVLNWRLHPAYYLVALFTPLFITICQRSLRRSAGDY